MPNVTFKETSRALWTRDDKNPPTFEQINCGTFQRIADACELMAKNHAILVEERDSFQRWWIDEKNRRRMLEHSNRALRGVITKLKNTLPIQP